MGVLSGQVALVTGAGRGIGRGVAVALAEAGADVAINFLDSEPNHSQTGDSQAGHSQAGHSQTRDSQTGHAQAGHRADAEETARQVAATGARAMLAPADVSNAAALERVVAEVASRLGRLSIAVANAVYSDREPFLEADLTGFRRTIDVTMWGAFHLLRASARQMIAQGGGGSIVMIGSPQAYIPAPGAMAYNMAKAAVDHMARTAAIELIDHRIRVNTLTPGWIDTPGERKFFSDDAIGQTAEKLPWGRLGQPAEIGRGVVFLCDPASDYVTGSRLLIDGGITLPWWARGGTGLPQ